MKLIKVNFFAVNRHQETYYQTMATRLSDSAFATSVMHKRRLPLALPEFSHSPELKQAISEAVLSEIRYLENKTERPLPGWKKSWLKAQLYLKACSFIGRFNAWFKPDDIDVMVLWNDSKWHQSMMKVVCAENNVQTVFMENGVLPDSVTLDPKGVNFNNALSRAPAFYTEWHSSHNTASYSFPEVETEAGKEDYIFVPFQVDYDTQIINHSPWLNNMEELYQQLERLLQDNPKLKFKVKEHPKSARDYSYLHRRHNNIEFCNKEDTNQLIAGAAQIITVNSTVGVEGLLQNKSVVNLGRAFYSLEGLCQTADSYESLRASVAEPKSPEQDLRNAFFAYLRHEYYVVGSWRQVEDNHVESFSRRLKSLVENQAG